MVRPVLVGFRQPDGTMKLFRGDRHVTTLLSKGAIREALRKGWIVSNGWRDELHRVVLAADARDRAVKQLERTIR